MLTAKQQRGTAMPTYDLRLYKRLQTTKPLHRVVDQYIFDAPNDLDAINAAKGTQIPSFDDSDYAILYGPNGAHLWRIDR
jgi:hypothetical protein